jgi:predicted dinucleotide-binding enzyme
VNPSAKQTVSTRFSRLESTPKAESESQSEADVRTTSLKPAVPSTSTQHVTESAAEKLERALANADWVHAYAHHRTAALHHEREAAWHRAEMARLEEEG